jgi:hypothetical protein
VASYHANGWHGGVLCCMLLLYPTGVAGSLLKVIWPIPRLCHARGPPVTRTDVALHASPPPPNPKPAPASGTCTGRYTGPTPGVTTPTAASGPPWQMICTAVTPPSCFGNIARLGSQCHCWGLLACCTEIVSHRETSAVGSSTLGLMMATKPKPVVL